MACVRASLSKRAYHQCTVLQLLSGSLSPISVVRSEIELLTAVGLKSQLAAATYRTCCDVSNNPVRLLSVRDRFIPP
eukprot:COSAG01_NODE_63_length_29632_cov_270.650662_36_plen_77_part_00